MYVTYFKSMGLLFRIIQSMLTGDSICIMWLLTVRKIHLLHKAQNQEFLVKEKCLHGTVWAWQYYLTGSCGSSASPMLDRLSDILPSASAIASCKTHSMVVAEKMFPWCCRCSSSEGRQCCCLWQQGIRARRFEAPCSTGPILCW